MKLICALGFLTVSVSMLGLAHSEELSADELKQAAPLFAAQEAQCVDGFKKALAKKQSDDDSDSSWSSARAVRVCQCRAGLLIASVFAKNTDKNWMMKKTRDCVEYAKALEER